MKHIAIFGATGAIGSAFIDYYAAQDDVEKIYAFSRRAFSHLNRKVEVVKVDNMKETSLESACKQVAPKQLDVIIIAVGVLHDAYAQPEKSLKECSVKKMQHIFSTNIFGPTLILKYFLPLLRRDVRAVCAVLSAKVGSISDNRLGGWYSYRASKAALNMVIKNASIELSRIAKKSMVIGLHPGTVNSYVSKPFQKNLPSGQLQQPEESVRHLVKCIESLPILGTGKCFSYTGEEVFP